MIALLAASAYGAACCGSGPPVDPGVLSPDEGFGLSAGLSAGGTPYRWSSLGSIHGSDGGELGTALAVRGRAARWLQGGVLLPAALRFGPGAGRDGGLGPSAGLSDPTLLLRFEAPSIVTGRPRPVLGLGGTLPIGQRTEDLARWGRLLVAPSLEIRWERVFGTLWGSLSTPVWGIEDPEIRPGEILEAGLSLGPRAERVTASGGIGLRGTLKGSLDGQRAGSGSILPLVRGGAMLGLSDHSRLVFVAELSPPVPYLGRNTDAAMTLAGSLMRTW